MNVGLLASLVHERARRQAAEGWLARVGATGFAVSIELVGAIPRSALGKAPLIRRAASDLAAAPAAAH